MLKLPRLSTSVVLHTFPIRFDTDILLRETPLDGGIIKIEKRGILRRGESKRDKIKRRNPKPVASSGFGHNSVTTVIITDGDGTQPMKEITVKIFHNGVFHMTGVLHPSYETAVLNILREKIPVECIKEGSWAEGSTRRVLLMNYSTEFENDPKISRVALQRYFQERGIQAEFEPDVSPCVKVVFPEKRWTACIFRTGKINLTALKSHEDCTQFVTLLEPHLRAYIESTTMLP
jgi:hypothetical protein